MWGRGEGGEWKREVLKKEREDAQWVQTLGDFLWPSKWCGGQEPPIPCAVHLEPSADKMYRAAVHDFFKRPLLSDFVTNTITVPEEDAKVPQSPGRPNRPPSCIRIAFADRVRSSCLFFRF